MLLSASADPSIRNGEEAVRLAKILRKLDGGRYYPFIVTEAAAYAEAGDCKKATTLQEEAIRLASNAQQASLQSALINYRANISLLVKEG